MSELITLYDGALAQLKREMPQAFTLIVNDSEYRDVGSLVRAMAIRDSMETLRAQASNLGYSLEIVRHDQPQVFDAPLVWHYNFKRNPRVVPAHVAIEVPTEVVHG